MYETREINTKHRVMLRGRELQTPLFTLSQFQTYKYVSSSYDHSELGNADADCNFLVNNRQTICAYYNERFLMSHINTQTHSHYYKKNIITKLFI